MQVVRYAAEAVRHKPHFRRERVLPSPVVNGEDAEPEFAPARDVRGAAALFDPLARCLSGGMVRVDSHEAQGDVRENCAKHGGVSFDVKSEPAILVLVVQQVPNHFYFGGRREHLVFNFRDPRRYDESGHEEHGPAVVARPVSVIRLKSVEELAARLEVFVDCGNIGRRTRTLRRAGRQFIISTRERFSLKTKKFIRRVPTCVPVRGE
mmetsp:Transcript_4328/g.10746  ORF Transcript_4328/g.10746 Transcript_4328/m.10746 type:complete len:208 (-) Transcript_4328:126-749(-)